ncbi:hypothetical protein D3C74_440320 [compost metagenome]
MNRYVIYIDESKMNKDEEHYLNLKGKWYTLEELEDVRLTASEMSSNRFYQSTDKEMSNLNASARKR